MAGFRQDDEHGRSESIALARGETLEERLIATKGHTSGFDLLRIGFAIFVLCCHSVYVTVGYDNFLWVSALRPVGAIVIPMFFVLSGFLVANSMVRTRSVSAFVTLRALRLVPALFVVVFVSALIIGPIVTTLPLRDYFTDSEFWSYWLNVIGSVQYELPEAVTANPVQIVNVSLWTIPYELACYGGLLVLFLAGVLDRRREVLGVFILVSIVLPIQTYIDPGFNGAVRPPGTLMMACFASGVLFYAFRHSVRLSRKWFAISLVVALVLLFRADTAFLAPLPIGYLTVFIGLQNLPRIPVLMRGDYSYGIYLYAFPIQQLVVWVSPLSYWWRTVPYSHVWYGNIAFALPGTIICAMLSWTLIEAPVMSRRKMLTEQVQQLEKIVVMQLRPVIARLLGRTNKTFS